MQCDASPSLQVVYECRWAQTHGSGRHEFNCICSHRKNNANIIWLRIKFYDRIWESALLLMACGDMQLMTCLTISWVKHVLGVDALKNVVFAYTRCGCNCMWFECGCSDDVVDFYLSFQCFVVHIHTRCGCTQIVLSITMEMVRNPCKNSKENNFVLCSISGKATRTIWSDTCPHELMVCTMGYQHRTSHMGIWSHRVCS